MSGQQRDNSGIIGVNNRKEKENHPDYSGQCSVDGKAFWISGWKRTGRDGSKFLSLAFKPKMAKDHQGAPPNPPAQTGAKHDFDDNIPFAWAALIPFAGILVHVVRAAML